MVNVFTLTVRTSWFVPGGKLALDNDVYPKGSWPIEQVISTHVIVKSMWAFYNARSLFFFFPLFSGLDFYGYIKLINFVRLKVGVPCVTSITCVWRTGS